MAGSYSTVERVGSPGDATQIWGQLSKLTRMAQLRMARKDPIGALNFVSAAAQLSSGRGTVSDPFGGRTVISERDLERVGALLSGSKVDDAERLLLTIVLEFDTAEAYAQKKASHFGIETPLDVDAPRRLSATNPDVTSASAATTARWTSAKMGMIGGVLALIALILGGVAALVG
jgi:hypothetical protein